MASHDIFLHFDGAIFTDPTVPIADSKDRFGVMSLSYTRSFHFSGVRQMSSHRPPMLLAASGAPFSALRSTQIDPASPMALFESR